jgi:UDP-N-acetylglucosamine transferase subunit ALG13
MEENKENIYDKKVQIFCVFGNAIQQFESLKNLVLKTASKNPHLNFIIQHGATIFDADELEKNVSIFAYCDNEKFVEILSQSDYVFGHCGVGVILQCSKMSKSFFGIPRLASKNEHIDDHQSDLHKKLIERKIIYDIREFVWGKSYSEVPKINFEIEDIGQAVNKKILGVCSIGGHREALIKTFEDNKLSQNLIKIIVDEKNFSMGPDIIIFKSCSKKKYYLFRVFQAIVLLKKIKPDMVYTTGAGVGFVFAIASWLLGTPVICQESLTRISTKSRWFKYASLFATKTVSSKFSNLRTDLKFDVFE